MLEITINFCKQAQFLLTPFFKMCSFSLNSYPEPGPGPSVVDRADVTAAVSELNLFESYRHIVLV